MPTQPVLPAHPASASHPPSECLPLTCWHPRAAHRVASQPVLKPRADHHHRQQPLPAQARAAARAADAAGRGSCSSATTRSPPPNTSPRAVPVPASRCAARHPCDCQPPVLLPVLLPHVGVQACAGARDSASSRADVSVHEIARRASLRQLLLQEGLALAQLTAGGMGGEERG